MTDLRGRSGAITASWERVVFAEHGRKTSSDGSNSSTWLAPNSDASPARDDTPAADDASTTNDNATSNGT